MAVFVAVVVAVEIGLIDLRLPPRECGVTIAYYLNKTAETIGLIGLDDL